MITEEIDQLLANLKLRRMREIVARELKRAAEQGTAPDEFLLRLLREQWAYAQERTACNRLESARIAEKFDLSTFPYTLQTGVQRSQIEHLSHLEFLAQGGNVIFIGEPGVGKTGIATGLLLRAVQAGHSSRFIKAQDLFDQMYASLADRTTRAYLNSLARLPLLLIDELGYLTIRPEQANIFFRLMDMRYTAKRSTLITTNLEYDGWGKLLGDEDKAKAMLSRLRHNCTTIHINGPTLRTPKG